MLITNSRSENALPINMRGERVVISGIVVGSHRSHVRRA
jgi:hypothetical protein